MYRIISYINRGGAVTAPYGEVTQPRGKVTAPLRIIFEIIQYLTSFCRQKSTILFTIHSPLTWLVISCT
jgi:hypothetical protein